MEYFPVHYLLCLLCWIFNLETRGPFIYILSFPKEISNYLCEISSKTLQVLRHWIWIIDFSNSRIYKKKKKKSASPFSNFYHPNFLSYISIFLPREKKNNNNFKLCHVTTTIQSDCHLSNHRIQYRSPIRTASRVVLRRSTAGPISEIFGIEESNTDNRPNPWWWWRPVVSRKPADPWNTIRTIPLRIARGIQYWTRRTSGKIPKTAPKFLKFPRARTVCERKLLRRERKKRINVKRFEEEQ